MESKRCFYNKDFKWSFRLGNITFCSSNGDLVSGSWDNTIKIWNPIDGNLKITLNCHFGPILSLAVLQNGDLASGSANKTIKIWNPNNGAEKMPLIGHLNSVLSLAVLQNGDLASGSEDNTIKLWSYFN